MRMPGRHLSVDAYLATLPPDRRAMLAALRAQIHALEPEVEECISYAMPAFRWRGHVIAGFQATRAGASYYPVSGTTLRTLADALGAYSQTKSAVHFDTAKGLPAALVKKLLEARKAEIVPVPTKAPTKKAPTRKAPTKKAPTKKAPRRTRSSDV